MAHSRIKLQYSVFLKIHNMATAQLEFGCNKNMTYRLVNPLIAAFLGVFHLMTQIDTSIILSLLNAKIEYLSICLNGKHFVISPLVPHYYFLI